MYPTNVPGKTSGQAQAGDCEDLPSGKIADLCSGLEHGKEGRNSYHPDHI